MANVRFRANSGAEYAISTMPELLPELETRIKMAEEVAKAIAPVEDGDYRDGIETSVGYTDKAQVGGRLLGTDWKSAFIEFGTENNIAHAVLRRAMGSIGLKVTANKRSKTQRKA